MTITDPGIIGLCPIHPQRRPHPCNGMTRQVSLGDGAYSTIIDPWADPGAEWSLRYADPDVVRYVAASILDSYQYLLSDHISTTEAIRRLRILRRATAEIERR